MWGGTCLVALQKERQSSVTAGHGDKRGGTWDVANVLNNKQCMERSEYTDARSCVAESKLECRFAKITQNWMSLTHCLYSVQLADQCTAYSDRPARKMSTDLDRLHSPPANLEPLSTRTGPNDGMRKRPDAGKPFSKPNLGPNRVFPSGTQVGSVRSSPFRRDSNSTR